MTDAAIPPAPSPKPAERLRSIDALRGFDMFWIAGGDALAQALGKWSGPPLEPITSYQLEHAEWAGFRFYDLIFPLFLFLVGAVLPFSLGKLDGQGRGAAYARIARRTALLVLLGLICNGLLKFSFPMRTAGVLQRIGLCYGIAAVITMNTAIRGRILATAAILLGYWALLSFVAPPGGTAGDLSPEGNLAGWVDRTLLPGKIMKEYYGFGDNEGILSTIPAVATTLLGVLAGSWLRSSRGGWTKAGGLLAAGVACLLVGAAWGQVFPIIKNLWTSSFVLVAGGFSLILLALFYAAIDVMGWKSWAFFFAVIGANAITIFIAPRFLDFAKMNDFFLGGAIGLVKSHGSPEFATVLRYAGILMFKWLFLFYLYRNRLFLRV